MGFGGVQKNEFKPNHISTEVRGNRKVAFVQKRENFHLLLGTVKIACMFQKQHCQLLLGTLYLKKNKCAVARLLRPKWSSSHPVSRITVIFSAGNGPASRASLAAKPGWVSLFLHVLPRKMRPALGLLWARPLQGRWAVREVRGAVCLVPQTLGPHVTLPIRRNRTGKRLWVPGRAPGEPMGLGIFQHLGVC